MSTITPCLWFDGNAEEAVAFYTSVVPNSRCHRHYGPGMPYPEGGVMTVAFELAGAPFNGVLDGGPQFPFTEAISLQISAADQDEVDRYWGCSPTAVSPARAAGSRTGSGCPGRSSRTRCPR